MHKGILITLEGIHGSGKSTVSQMLFERLEKLKLDIILTVDQAGTDLGKRIREMNLEEGVNADVVTEALLVAAARRQNIAEIIRPSLAQGKIVICERYTDAFFAFQGFGRQLSINFLGCIGSSISEGTEPDLTVLLDVDPEIGLARLCYNTMHRVEREPIEFHKRVREGYLARAREYPNRIKIVDARSRVDEVFEEVWGLVKDFLTMRGIALC